MERPRAQSLDAAFLYISSPGDFGWTKTHEDARVELEEYFKGEGVKANFKTYNSVDRSNIAKAVDSLVEGGVEVIVTTSGEWKPEIAELADKHEDIKFLACSTFQEKENLQSFFGRMYQAKFLAGIVAARASETGVLGYVGSIQNHETMRHLNAFALGAYFITKQDAKQGLAADRDIEVLVEFTGAWFDAGKDKAAAERLIAAGADVLTNGTDTDIVIETVERFYQRGSRVYSVGTDNVNVCGDRESCLGTAYFNWVPILKDQFTSIIDGTWKAGAPIWESLPNTDVVRDSTVNVKLNEYTTGFDEDGGTGGLTNMQSDLNRIRNIVAEEPYLRLGPIVDSLGQVHDITGDDYLLGNSCWFSALVRLYDGEVEVKDEDGNPEMMSSYVLPGELDIDKDCFNIQK